VSSVKYETSSNVHSGCRTCIVILSVMECQEQLLVAQHALNVTGLAVVCLARLINHEAVPKCKHSLSIPISISGNHAKSISERAMSN
jgi:hypothetical protein